MNLRFYTFLLRVIDSVLSLLPRSERTQSHSTSSLAENPAGVLAVSSVHDLDLLETATSRWLLDDLRLAVLELTTAHLVVVVGCAEASALVGDLDRRCLHGLAHAVLAHHLLLGTGGGRGGLLAFRALLLGLAAFDQTGQKD